MEGASQAGECCADGCRAFCLAGGLFKGQVKSQVKGYFVLPEGSPSRAGSRPGPAPALSGKHNRPLRGFPQQNPFPDGPGAIRSCSARLLAASLRLALENAFASAAVMPPQGQNPGQNRKDERLLKS